MALRIGAVMALLLAVFMHAAPAGAADLVVNIGENNDSTVNLSSSDVAQRFRTGNNDRGYEITSVGIELNRSGGAGTAPDVNFNVEIWTRKNSTEPRARLVTLTHPTYATTTGNAVYWFTTTGIALEANTSYFVVVDSTSASNSFRVQRASSNDQAASNGWDIDNSSLFRSRTTTGVYSTNNDSLKIRIRGTRRSTSSDYSVERRRVTNVQAHAPGGTSDRLELTWDAPRNNPAGEVGDPERTGTDLEDIDQYEILFTGSGSDRRTLGWRCVRDINDPTIITRPIVGTTAPNASEACFNDRRVILPNLEADTEYKVQIRARYTYGVSRFAIDAGPWAVMRARTGDGSAVLFVADAEATEGTDTTADFVVTLEPAATETVTVDYATSDGTAEAPGDYTAVSNTLTFLAGETQKTVSVPIVDDSVEDSGETFTLTLSSPSRGARIRDAEATGTILNTEVIQEEQALIATFSDLPESHDGETPFEVTLTFSEALMSDFAESAFEDLLEVENGAVTGTRHIEGIKKFGITITPANDGDVSFTLPVTSNCATSLSVCTGEDQPVQEAVTVDIIGPTTVETEDNQEDQTPAGVSIADASAVEAEGATLDFVVTMSRAQVEDVTMHYGTRSKTAKSGQDYTGARSTLTIAAGQTGATIVVPVLDDAIDEDEEYMEVWISRPTGGNVSITDNTGRGTITDTETPADISIADASAEEGPGATLDFVVTMSRAQGEDVTMRYGTRSKTARAGQDYTGTRSTFTIAAGATGATIVVPVLDDAIDEGEEYMEVWISRPSGGNVQIADNTARGTITNSDPMPQAWMARFGRTVADQVIDAVEGRFSASRTAGVEMTLAGERIGWTGGTDAEPEAAEARSQALAEWLQGADDGGTAHVDYRSRAVTSLDLLTGSSFALTGESASGGMMSLWGRGAVSNFDGREGDLSLDGEVSSMMLGADWARERWTAGLLVSRSEGEGGYLDPEAESGSEAGMEGKVESTLTGLFPYGRYAASDRLTLWGIAGYGTGELTLTPEGQTAIRTDTDLLMGAVGLHRVAVEAPTDGGIELAVKTDALAVRTTTDEVRGDSDNTGNLAATEADVTRLRLGLEGTWRGLTVGEGTLSPVGEIGLRHDGGDAETGFGLDLGVGFSWSDPESGLTAELRGRGLLTHESEGFRDRGISGSFAWDPGQGSGRGPKVTLTRSMGASASGGMDALLGHRHLGGLAADDPGSESGAGSDDLANRRLELRMGYGYSVLEDRFTMTPEFGMGISNGHRDYTLGWRLVRRAADWGSAELSFEARRSESVDSAPQHGVGLTFIARF